MQRWPEREFRSSSRAPACCVVLPGLGAAALQEPTHACPSTSRSCPHQSSHPGLAWSLLLLLLLVLAKGSVIRRPCSFCCCFPAPFGPATAATLLPAFGPFSPAVPPARVIIITVLALHSFLPFRHLVFPLPLLALSHPFPILFPSSLSFSAPHRHHHQLLHSPPTSPHPSSSFTATPPCSRRLSPFLHPSLPGDITAAYPSSILGSRYSKKINHLDCSCRQFYPIAQYTQQRSVVNGHCWVVDHGDCTWPPLPERVRGKHTQGTNFNTANSPTRDCH